MILVLALSAMLLGVPCLIVGASLIMYSFGASQGALADLIHGTFGMSYASMNGPAGFWLGVFIIAIPPTIVAVLLRSRPKAS
jgi:hypothetical protein